ncbi:DUF3600 domain-containing protein [Ammoniphilus sp. 3BR4]|uniref:DUF3600 domain-containing protein n=1 Tax=Ammoniphilus sp. 3BR4 TaxID=3158265 RepID=UPI003466DC0A
MSIENQLREKLHNHAKKMKFPNELDQRVRTSYELHLYGESKGKQRKPLLTFVLAAMLLIPTSALAYSLLADDIYGSFDRLKMKIATATMEKYLLFNAKLTTAKSELGDKKYDEFKTLVKAVTSAKMEYGNKNGDIDYDHLPKEKIDEIKKAKAAIQPYFDELNGEKSTKEVLTAQEFVMYLEAEMTMEKIRAKTGMNPIYDANDVPIEYREQYKKAWEFYKYVDEKR